MRKNLAKVLASASFVVALILIVILLVTAFGGIKEDDFNNGLVHGLLIAISVLYVILAGTTIALLFIQGETLHEIVVKNGKGESVRVSVGVVKKEIKKACHMVEGVKFKKISLLGDGFGVTLKLSIKVEDKDIDEVEIATRCYIEDCMAKTFCYHFTAIDINIMQLIPKYKANAEEINAEVEKQLGAKRAEQEKILAEKRAAEEKEAAQRADIEAGLNPEQHEEKSEETSEETTEASETSEEKEPEETAEQASEESEESEQTEETPEETSEPAQTEEQEEGSEEEPEEKAEETSEENSEEE